MALCAAGCDVNEDVETSTSSAAATPIPATVTPIVHAEVATDVPVATTSDAGATKPAIAFDGTNYLVVWADQRDSGSSDFDIWGTRVDQSGAILDATAIRIGGGPGAQTNPAVAFDGTQFVVAWEDYKVTGGTEADIAVATVSVAGSVTPLPSVAATTANETAPSLAGNGAGALLTWATGGQIVGAIEAGSFGASFAITSGTNVHKDAAAGAQPGGGYLVVFAETVGTDDNARGQLVGAAGTLDGAVFDVCAGAAPQRTPSISFDGTGFDVVWANGSGSVYGTRVTTTGGVLDTHLEGTLTVGGKLLTNTTTAKDRPTIACSATGCIVSWDDRRNLAASGTDLYAQLVTPSFVASGSELFVTRAPQNQTSSRAVAAGGAFFVVWQDLRSGGNTIAGARVSGAGAVLDANALELVGAYGQERGPVVARSGTVLGVAWSDSRGSWGEDVGMVRLDAAGTVVDAPPLGVAAPGAQITPAMTSLGAGFLVAWTDTRNGVDRDVYASRVLESGVVLDATGIALSTATGDQLVPAAAASPGDALVVWQDGSQRSVSAFDIAGAIVDTSGAVVAGPFAISQAPGDQMTPAVAYDPTADQYVVVWCDGRGGASVRDIYGARVSRTGSVLDASGVVVATAVGTRFKPRIAASSNGLFVVYEDQRAGNRDIFGTRVTAGASLAIVDPAGIALTTDPNKQASPDVAAIGAGYFVTWSDPRGAATTQNDVYGQLVASSGALIGDNFVVAGTTEDEGSPMVAAVSGAAVLVTYAVQRDSLHAPRAVTRLVETPPSLVSIDVTPVTPSIANGTTQAFAATGTYTDGSVGDITASVTWSSSSTAVATITTAGVAKGVAVGTATISATLSGVTGSTDLAITPAVLTGLDVSPLDPSVAKGTNLQFTVLGQFSDGTAQDLTTLVTWSSSNTAIATVSNILGTQGSVTTLAAGQTTITATRGTITGTSQLTVTPAALVSITVAPPATALAKGTTAQLVATGLFGDGTTQDITTQVTWSSSATSIATVSNTSPTQGRVTAVAPGTATITAALSGKTGSASVTVTNASLTSIAVTPTLAKVAIGYTIQYTATGTFSDATTQNLTTQVTWTSTNTVVATTSNAAGSQGLAKVKAVGATTIRATFGTVSGSTTLTGTNATLVTISVTPGSVTLPAKGAVQLTATGTFSDGSTLDLTTQVAWKSSKSNVANVNATGRVTANKKGSALITAKKATATGVATITVN